MIARLILSGASMVLAVSGARADPRIATRFYQPTSVVVVQGRAGIETTVAFNDDEHIENVAVGNSAAWQVTPNKRANLLFVKPATARARTNMTVITDQRTYLFDLVSSPAIAPVYMLRFTYPALPKPVTAAATPLPPPQIPTQTAAIDMEVAPAAIIPDPANLNFAWVPNGDRQLLPERTFDDGHSTFLAWNKDVTLPAILTRGPTGQEGPVNFTVRGEYIVVDGVPAQLVLRAGKQMATLTPAPRPIPTGSNTAVASATLTASARP